MPPHPADDAESSVPEFEILHEQTPDPLRVLLVEDDPDHAALVEAYLETAHDPAVALEHAPTVGAAVDALAAARTAGAPFHVVLSDQQLPDSAYWETMTRVVAAAEGIPVVALTSLGDLDVALEAVRVGAQDYLVKSELTPELLHRTLRYAVERARRNDALEATNAALRQTLRHIRQMQAQLIEQEKLAGLGRLLSGIAHELRNPLGLAVGFAEVVEREAEALAGLVGEWGEDAAEHVEVIRENAARAAAQGRRADAVVHAMYLHARGVDGVLRPVDVGSVVRSATAGKAESEVELAVDVAPRLGVLGVGTALARMLTNVLDNATLAASLGGGHVAVSTRREGDEIVMTVEDDGPGFDHLGVDLATEPFVSGWPSGRRIGLGLSLARAIAVGHGGRVELGRSEALGGARVRIVLPATDAPRETLEGA